MSRRTCPPPSPRRGVEVYFSIGLGASVSRGRGKVLGFPPSALCAPQKKKKKSPPLPSMTPNLTGRDYDQSEKKPTPYAHQCSWARPRSPPPPRTLTLPGTGRAGPTRVPVTLRSLTLSCSAPFPPYSYIPTPRYLLRDPGQQGPGSSRRPLAPRLAEFAIRGWGFGKM